MDWKQLTHLYYKTNVKTSKMRKITLAELGILVVYF